MNILSANNSSFNEIEKENLRLIDQNNSLKAQLHQKEKELEEALISMESYKKMYETMSIVCDNIPDLLWAKDPSRRFIFTNKQMRDKLLISDNPQEPFGKNDMYFAMRQRISHPDNPEWHTFGEICRDSDSIVIDGKGTGRFEEFGNVKGEFLFLDVIKTPVFSKTGELLGTVGCARDITEEKIASQYSLKKNKFNSMESINATDISVEFFLTGEWKTVNKALADLTGYSESELLNMSIIDNLHPSDKGTFSKSINSLISGKQNSIQLELRCLKFDSTVSWLKLHIWLDFDSKGNPLYFFCSITDITSQILTRQELKNAESFFRLVWEESFDAMRLIDSKGNIVLVNQAFCKLMEMPREKLLGSPFSITYSKEDSERIFQYTLEIIQSQNVSTIIEKEVTLWTGKKTWFDISNSFITFEDGSYNFLSIFREIAERKMHEFFQIQQNERLTKISQTFLTFTSDTESNINKIVTLLGDLLGATCALYNRLERGMLCSFGKWNIPLDYEAVSRPEGHICYDIIMSGVEDQVYLHDLQNSRYAISDPNVKNYNLKTYLGKVVKIFGKSIGSLCAVFNTDFEVRENDAQLIDILASAISNEEIRQNVILELEANEERLRTLINAMPAFICFKDGDGRWLETNNYTLNFLEMTRPDYLGKTDLELAEAKKPFNKIFKQSSSSDEMAWKEHELFHREETLTLPANSEIILDFIKVPLFHKDGSRKGLVIIGQDITEQKLAQLALRTSEQRYRTVVEDQIELISRFLPDGTITFVNHAYCKFFGKQIDELIGSSKFSILSGNSTIDLNLKLPTISPENPELVFDRSHYTIDGETVCIEWTERAIFDENNLLLEFLSVGRDITEKKDTESQLRFLGSIAEQVSDSIVATDRSFKIIFVNRATEELYGYSKTELIGNGTEMLLDEYWDEALMAQVYETISSGKIWSGEMMNQKKNGTSFICSINISPLYSADEKILSYVGIYRDITFQRKFETELLLAKEKAEESNKVKTSLIANMSHEFRTPMNGILGFSEILTYELEDPDERKMARSIFISGRRLMNTLNNIMDLAQLESSTSFINRIDLNVSEKIRSAVKPYETAAVEKGLEFICNVNDENVHAYMDERTFQRILDNLIDNAIKFTSKGAIEVSLSRVKGEEGNHCHVVIKDSGIGIPADQHNFIFEEFRQASEGLGRKFEGSGLGLTVAKKMSQLMDGRLGVQSVIGVGSVFTFQFPDTSVENLNDFLFDDSLEDSENLVHVYDFNPILIYIGDDFEEYQLINEALNDSYVVEYTEKLPDIISRISVKTYDLIFVSAADKDISTAIAKVIELRSVAGYAFTPFVGVIPNELGPEINYLLANGFNQCIEHPLNKETLKKTVNNIFFGNS